AVAVREEAFGGADIGHPQCTLDYQWYVPGASQIEARCVVANMTSIAYGEKLTLSDDLTLSGAFLVATGVWEMQTSASFVWGSTAIVGMTRTASASPAAVKLIARRQRIA